jgi:hypothetical protein
VQAASAIPHNPAIKIFFMAFSRFRATHIMSNG